MKYFIILKAVKNRRIHFRVENGLGKRGGGGREEEGVSSVQASLNGLGGVRGLTPPKPFYDASAQ